mgnify:FL=1
MCILHKNCRMKKECLNCGHPLSGHYCSFCGQKAEVSRLNWKSLGEELLHFLTHIEKGFITTSGQLLIRPGVVAQEYLEGKRKKYHKPVGFLLIWIALFTLIYHGSEKLANAGVAHGATLFSDAANKAIFRFRSIVELCILPFSALNSWLVIARNRLNYIEILVVFFYFTSFLFMLLSLQLILAILTSVNFHTSTFDLVTIGIYTAWLLYAGFSFYRQFHIQYLVLRMILSLVTGVLVYFGLAHLLGLLRI